MNYKSILSVVAIIFLLLSQSCKNCNNQKGITNTVVFSRSDFRVKPIIAEEIPFSKSLNPMTLNVVEDSLLLVVSWEPTEYYGELYRLKDLSLVTKFAKRGKGPGEYLSTYFGYKTSLKNSLIIIDGIKKEGTIFSIDSLYCLKENYLPRRFSLDPMPNVDIEVVGENVITFNKYYLTDLRYRNNVEPLLSYKLNGVNDFSMLYKDCKHHTYNVNGGYIAAHPTQDIIWLIYTWENRIELYNKNLELQKTLLGPDFFELEYEVINVLGTDIVAPKKDIDIYGRCFYTLDHIYIIYRGEINGEREHPLCVLKFKWDGTPTQLYEIDKRIGTLYVDSNEEYMYGTHTPKGEYPKLIRYKL
jgi:hypothetical protein